MSTPTQRPHTISASVVSGTPTSYTLSWSHNTTNTINYTVQKSINNSDYSSATAPTVTVVNNQTSYSCVVSELELGRKYYLKVTAVGSGGSLQSDNSAEITIGSPSISDISADFGEVLDSDETSGNVDVSLTFNDIDSKFKFKLFLNISSGELLIGEQQITSTNATVTIPRVYLLALDQSSSYSFVAKIYDASTDVQQSHIGNGTFSFSTSANLSPSFDNELALGVGDPYISPLIGETYKLPEEHANYRYLDNSNVTDRFLVNIQTGLLSQTELEEANKYSLDKIESEIGTDVTSWLKENNLVLPTKSCFVNYIHMRNGESHITIDTKNFNIFSISSFEDFEIENVENGPIDECFAPYATSIPLSTTKISCNTEGYGKVSLYVYEFSNLQLRNAFRIVTEKSLNLSNSVGAMIFKSNESFSLPKLNSDKFVKPALELENKYVPQLFVTKERVGAIAIRV
tara:strand:+ start:83 stop:1459 length:1377 start_codon:yes stop_codon:yes gene_type:complete